MRRFLFAVPFLIACGGAETPPADSAAMAPAGLTDADVAGTWSGTVTPEGQDTLQIPWTDVCGAGTCRLVVSTMPNDTIVATYTIQGDSVVGTSSPYADTTIVKGAMLIDTWVARISGNQLTGTGMAKLADRPDSVVMRYRFTGTKNP
jgi:hypothetical protein